MKKILVLVMAAMMLLSLTVSLLPIGRVHASLPEKPKPQDKQITIKRKIGDSIPAAFRSSAQRIRSIVNASKQLNTQGQKTDGSEEMSDMGRLAYLSSTGQLDAAIGTAKSKLESKSAKLSVAGEVSSDTPEEPAGPSGGQAELSIAADSTGQHIVVGANDTRGFSLNPTSVSGFAYSDDGGQTFVDGGQLPVNTGTDTIGTTILPQVFGDPEVKYLGGSNFIYFSIMVKKFSATQAVQTMCFHRSTDFGHTWTGPFEVTAATNPNGQVTAAGAPRDSADKEFAAVDPETGRVMMSWSNFTPFAPGGVEIAVTFSDNIMAAVPTWVTRRVIAATSADGQASIPRFASNSANAYVAWRRSNLSTTAFSRSTDNGLTWSAPVNTSTQFFQMDQVLGNDRVNTSPSMDVRSDGTIYLVYSNNNSRDGADIAFQRSTDGGLTFSAPVFLNSRPGNDRAQWFPWVSVDNSSGRVWVHYLDQGIATSGDLTEATYLYSDDNGLTWSKPMPLSDRPFHAGYGNDTGQPNLGDYNQSVAQNGEFFGVWGGTSNEVSFIDGQPNSSYTVPDVYFRRTPSGKAALSLGNVTFGESGGNGNIDVGDQVSLQIPLRNYVTNPLSASTVSGISATLSSSTTGVTVTQAISAYPNATGGVTVSNSTNYVLQIGPAFVAGSKIELSLSVSSSQGSTVLLHTQSTGTPLETTIFQQNFDSIAPGTLPANWANIIGGSSAASPWTTNNTFNAGNNGAFHTNTSGTRFARLSTPSIVIPANAEYVTLDFDVKYDTEDEPAFNIWAYDGFLLRITDFTPGRFARANLVEAFAEEFTTGSLQHYPKHFPRSSNTAYFEDMSAWSGDSNGVKHVRMKLRGMQGSTIQLRWEFTQDSVGTCADVRPGHTCGVLFDNVVMKSVVSTQPTTLTVDSASGQYSDQVTLKATVNPNVVNFQGGTQTATGNVQFSVNGSAVGLPVAIDSSGVATLPYTIPLAPGSYPIGAAFTSTNPAFQNSSGSNTLTVSKEDAVVTFPSSNPFSVKVNSAGGTAGPITICADISEVADGSLGDTTNATATFSISAVVGGSAPAPGVVSYSGGGVGVARRACITINNVAVDLYDITVTVGGYYRGTDSTVLAVYDPSLGFITGGGTVTYDGNRANFGINVKYLKNGKAQGSMLFMEHNPDGSVTKIKTNAMQSASIVGNTAVILAKATVDGVGNYNVRVIVVDNGNPGSADQIALTTTKPDGTTDSSLTFALTTLNGGNIQVPQNPR